MATLHSAFSAEQVMFLDIVPSKQPGLHTAAMGYGTSKSKPVIQTPRMRLPFGYGSSKFPDSKALRIAFKAGDSPFERELVALDARVEKWCEEHIKELFPTMKDPVNKTTYTPLLEESPKHTSKLRTKLSTRGAEINTTIVDETGKELTVEALTQGSEVTAILGLAYVWSANANKQYGITAYVESLRVHSSGAAVGFVNDPENPTEQPEQATDMSVEDF